MEREQFDNVGVYLFLLNIHFISKQILILMANHCPSQDMRVLNGTGDQ
jgi:hypothetical protein